VIDCSLQFACMVIPQLVTKMVADDALFILLVPHTHVATELARYCFPQRFRCIVVSAEGPPAFLIKMEKKLKLPVLALLDTDRCSLKMLAFYGRRLKNFKWLGIRPTDIIAEHNSCRIISMDSKDIETAKDILNDDYFKTRLISMDSKDIETAKDILNDDYFKTRPKWIEELHIMLKNKQKIAIESLCLSGVRSYLTTVFLPMKLQLEDWI
jgi:DNA topoisomerase VI subunit A